MIYHNSLNHNGLQTDFYELSCFQRVTKQTRECAGKTGRDENHNG
jgi:hypothetical protein